MKKSAYLFVIILISVFIFGCDTGNNGSQGGNIVEPKYNYNNKCKSLLIIAEDRSGSTSDHRKLTSNDYLTIFKAFENNYSGQIAVRIIGNPAPQEKEFFILNLKELKPYLKMDNKDMLLSEKTVLRNKNQKIAIENEKITQSNLEKIKVFINEKINPKVVKYKPYKNKDVTDIADALHHIETKVNEPTFANYNKIQVLIISDGIHDAYKLKKALSLKLPANTELYIIGWKDKTVFSKVKNIENFESIDGFIEYFKNSKCNNN